MKFVRPATQTDLTDALISADLERAREVAFSRRQCGDSLAALCDGPIADALHQVGERWKHGPEGILIEHRTTLACINILAHLRAVLPTASGRPLAVGGTPAGDPYQVPSMMAGLILASEGWEEMNLGPDLTVEAFAEAIRFYHPGLIWISFSVVDAGRQFLDAWKPLLGVAERAGVTIVVGGRAFPAEAKNDSERVQNLPNMAAFARWLRDCAE